jgi:hypothetical protein
VASWAGFAPAPDTPPPLSGSGGCGGAVWSGCGLDRREVGWGGSGSGWWQAGWCGCGRWRASAMTVADDEQGSCGRAWYFFNVFRNLCRGPRLALDKPLPSAWETTLNKKIFARESKLIADCLWLFPECSDHSANAGFPTCTWGSEPIYISWKWWNFVTILFDKNEIT